MKFKNVSYLVFLLIICSKGRLLAQHIDSIKAYYAPSANQAVAADADYLYAIGNAVIEKYDKKTGDLIKKWEDKSKDFKHLNSGVVIGGKLYCAHSNFPDIPMASSIEIFDTQSLEPIGSHSFGITIGSATWLDFYDGHWYVAFAHYNSFQEKNGKDNAWTQIIQFTEDWQRREGWILPKGLIKEFDGMSNSGGFISKEGELFLTGHDFKKMYLLEFPSSGYQLKWVKTLSVPFEGQGIAVDPSDSTIIYGISRSKKLIYQTKLNEKTK